MQNRGIVVPYDDRFKDTFIDPAKYYIVNAMGDAVYYRTRSRQAAQDLADKDYGTDKYRIRVAMKAEVR